MEYHYCKQHYTRPPTSSNGRAALVVNTTSCHVLYSTTSTCKGNQKSTTIVVYCSLLEGNTSRYKYI